MLVLQVCGEAGVTVRPRTASGRDAMLRAGAEAAVDAAMQQSGAQLGGMAPSTFVTGLARDLGQPWTACRMNFACYALLYRQGVLWIVWHADTRKDGFAQL